jgi:hypothetical protein
MPSPITTISISHQKVDIEADYKTLIVGFNAELATVDTLVIGGKSILRADLVARFQARIDAAEGVKSARGLLQSAIAYERTVDAEVRPLRAATKVYLQGRYGKSSPEMQKFGFTQTRKGKASTQTKAAAQTKAKATRAARGTKGKQQKKAIKAVAPATTAAPTATPPSLSTTGAPTTGTPTGGTHT